MKTMQESFAELAVVIEQFKKALRESALFSALARVSCWIDVAFDWLSRRN